MATSLYDLSVPTFIQTLKGVAGCLGRAVTHCARIGSDPDDFVNARLIADMAPFHFQIEALSNHSVGGLETVKTGVFAPARLVGTVPFARLRTRVDEAIGALEALSPDEVNGWAGKVLDIAIYRPSDDEDLVSPWAPRQMAFTSETFLLSFSLPNFYFHVVTAYDILRSRGVPIGKRAYQGRLRTIGS
jgi:uncharacterized protein